MPKFLRDGRAVWTLAAAVSIVGGACSSAMQVGGAVRNHPDALVGTWVDVAKSTPNDTALWILRSTGDDLSQHVVRVRADASDGAAYAMTGATHYGYWFAQGALADSAHRAICFTRRPGRSAPTCLAFELDSVRNDDGTLRRRLLVRGYRGEHHVSDRLFMAREP